MQDELLWAPWRLAYIAGGADAAESPVAPASLVEGAEPGCFLCQAAGRPADPADDRRRLVLCRTEEAVVVLNRFPYNNGHLLVAPRSHRARLADIGPQVQAELQQWISRMIGLYERLLRAEGFNVGLNLGQVAGAGVPGHLHWHLVPRWTGDHNFMPTIAAARVIPQALDALWEAVTRELARLDKPDETIQ
jgi:ATP adenylyltransferase